MPASLLLRTLGALVAEQSLSWCSFAAEFALRDRSAGVLQGSESVRSREAGASDNFARLKSDHVLEPRTQLVDDAEGKRAFGRRDASSEHASPFARFFEFRYPALIDSCEGSLVPYAAAYFVGSLTVNRCRPFLRRRLRTALPHLVSMRVRNPWVRIRRLFRGRYVGLPIDYSNQRR